MLTILPVSNLTVPIAEGHCKEKPTAEGTTKQLIMRLKITFLFFNKKPHFSSIPETTFLPPDLSAGLSLCVML